MRRLLPFLVVLFILFAFGVVGGGLGINSLVKAHRDKARFRKRLPSNVRANINTSDVFDSGVVATVVCGLIALVALTSIVVAVIPSSRGFWQRSRRVQGAILTFLAVWLFATQTAFTVFFAKRGPKVTAFIGRTKLPAQTVKSFEMALGAVTEYRQIHYLKLSAILPWFAFLFGVISAALLFSPLSSHDPTPANPAPQAEMAERQDDPQNPFTEETNGPQASGSGTEHI